MVQTVLAWKVYMAGIALVENARSYGLLIHPYTFRADRLPPYASSFQELLDVFFNEVKVDGIFTDFPDQVVDYLEKNSIN